MNQGRVLEANGDRCRRLSHAWRGRYLQRFYQTSSKCISLDDVQPSPGTVSKTLTLSARETYLTLITGENLAKWC
jgi:hypothetical protein